MILVDTSVWIDHFRNGVEHLAAALETGQVLMHPFVLGEIACGSLSDRREILQLMAELPRAPVATDTEALRFIDEHALMGRGIVHRRPLGKFCASRCSRHPEPRRRRGISKWQAFSHPEILRRASPTQDDVNIQVQMATATRATTTIADDRRARGRCNHCPPDQERTTRAGMTAGESLRKSLFTSS